MTKAILGFHEDAATDTGLITRQLTWLLEQKVALYRPAKWRSIMRTTSKIPTWVANVAIHKIEGFGSLLPSGYKGAQNQKSDVVISEKLMPMIEFVTGYDVMDREIERAAATGMNVSDARVRANSMAAEQTLDKIAATGDSFSIGLGGIASNSDVSIVTLSGVAWAVATFDQILGDANALVNAVPVGSKENFVGDTLVLPLAQYQTFTQARSTFDRTALEVFREQNPQVRRVLPWDRLKTAGAGSTTRAMAFDSTAPEGPQMLMSRELTEDPARRISRGVTVDQSLITGGVLIEAATSIVYGDGI